MKGENTPKRNTELQGDDELPACTKFYTSRSKLPLFKEKDHFSENAAL